MRGGLREGLTAPSQDQRTCLWGRKAVGVEGAPNTVSQQPEVETSLPGPAAGVDANLAKRQRLSFPQSPRFSALSTREASVERRADGFVQRGHCRPRGLVTEGEGPRADAALPSLNPSPSSIPPLPTLFSAATCGKAGTAQTCPPPCGPGSGVRLHRPRGHCIQDKSQPEPDLTLDGRAVSASSASLCLQENAVKSITQIFSSFGVEFLMCV